MPAPLAYKHQILTKFFPVGCIYIILYEDLCATYNALVCSGIIKIKVYWYEGCETESHSFVYFDDVQIWDTVIPKKMTAP